MKRLLLLLPLLLAHTPVNADEIATIYKTQNSEVIKRKHPITDHIEYGLFIYSKNSQPDSINAMNTTGLILKCMESGIHALFSTNTYNGDKDQYLIMRWEDEKPIKKSG